MRPGLTRFLEHRDRQGLAALLFLELRKTKRRGKTGRTATDDQDVNFKCFPFHLTFFKFSGQRRRDLEQVAHDAVVGHFEDRRVGILVDRDDRP
jgi:hypothetical protein